ncbi:MAG: VTT domain-containing protein [Vicinamibacterales bacterium]
MSLARLRMLLLALWILCAGSAVYLFLFHRDFVQRELGGVVGASALMGGALYLLLGCVRGFTLIPSTSLVVLAVAFFPPLRLFLLTLAGIVVSSASIYVFSEALHLDELLRRRHARQYDRVRDLLERHEFPIIVGWSFFPLVPTDLICYLCGILRVNMAKCLLGVALGEGAICGIYIFLGDYLLRLFHLKG